MEEIVRYYEGFDEWARLDTPAGRLELRRALEVVDRELPAGADVLDLGGGPGRYTLALADRRHRVTLVDLSPRQVEVARERLAAAGLTAEAMVGDARDLGRFPDACFDAVLAFGPFYHLPADADRRRAAAEVARVLRPGGVCLLLFVPRLSGLRGLLERGAGDPGQVRPETLAACAAEGVFRNASPRGFQSGWYGTRAEITELISGVGLDVGRIESLKGVLAGREAAFLALEERDPDLFAAGMAAVRQTATEPAVVDLGDQAIVVARKRPALLRTLHHVVLWTFADAPDKAGRIREARRLVSGCAGLVPGMLRFQVGAAEDGLEHSADLVLLSAFVDRAALDAYQAHPQHVPVKERLRGWVRAREVLDFWGE